MRNLFSLFLALTLPSCATSPKGPPPTAQDLPHAAGTERKARSEAYGAKIMISTDGEAASRAGARMKELGGNAVDAAIAASFAISVERPHSTGLGGGGFLLLHLADHKKTLAFDFRERAPRAARKEMFLDHSGNPVPGLSTNGALAAAVPGLVAGLVEIQAKYGKLSLAQVIAPAIELAENGFPVYGALAAALEDRREVLSKFPATKKIFFMGNRPLREGEVLRQADLGRTLRLIAKNGKSGFYRGSVAKAIVNGNRALGGLITQGDLDAYEVKERTPVRGTFQGHEVVSMPPPSSGGIHVIQILNMIENDPFAEMGQASPQTIHLFSSSMQRAFADRAEYLGDTDFVKVPINGLTSKKYASVLRSSIPEYTPTPAKDLKAGKPYPPFEPEHTTHLTVMDGDGNTVSTTQTINGWMGSGLVIEGTGVLLNNEMDDFSIKTGAANLFGAIGGEKNAIAPGKRPLSSMSPTIVFLNGEPVLALGSPSGTRIITCVTQVIVNRLTFGLPLYDSVAAVRYHQQWLPDEIRVDSPGFPEPVRLELEKRGHKVRTSDLGCRVAAIERKDELLHGVADPRGEGISLGD